MNKNLFKIVLGVAVIATSFSSCTKEQTSLNLLKGTWTLQEEYDTDGDLVDPTDSPFNIIDTYTEEITFFECNGKDNEPCTGVSKTVVTYNDGTDDNINAGEFEYEVYDKSVLVIAGQVYDIEELKKKDLTIVPTEYPQAKRVYSKN